MGDTEGYRLTAFTPVRLRRFRREYAGWTAQQHGQMAEHHRVVYDRLRHGDDRDRRRAGEHLTAFYRHGEFAQIKRLTDGNGCKRRWLEGDLLEEARPHGGLQRWGTQHVALLRDVVDALGQGDGRGRLGVMARRLGLLAMDIGGGLVGRLWAEDQVIVRDQFVRVEWSARQWNELGRWARRRDVEVSTVARELELVGLEHLGRRLGLVR